MVDNGHPMPLIRAAGVCKGYDHSGNRIVVLNGLSFQLALGETIAIVGASGIGKSTLLHVLGTLDRPDAGELFYHDENVLLMDDSHLAAFRNRTIGFVFQFHHLLPEFTALENVMMPALISGMENGAAAAAAERILVRVGLKTRLTHRATELSGGEQQRVALARALVLGPRILLADEPTGNLDRENSDHIHQLLMELNQELGMALVVVTHNLELARLVSRQMTLTNGKLGETDMR